MPILVRRGGRALAGELAGTLDAWTEQAPLVANLHSGDIGWHLRLADEAVDDAFLVWTDADTPWPSGSRRTASCAPPWRRHTTVRRH